MRQTFSRLSLAVSALLLMQSHVHAQGILLPGGGANHLSMAGASTVTPVDAIGALYWNPAATGRLGRSEVAIGGAFVYPNIDLTSTAPEPLGFRSGTTRSDSGVGVTSNLGVVYEPDCGPFTYGLGLNSIGGGIVNFPGDLSNPILSGVGPLNNVQGPIASNLILMQLSPTVAYRVSDRLIVGVSGLADIAITSFDPAYFAAPEDSNGDGIRSFPSATHSRPFWGGGGRIGFTYAISDKIATGFSYTSPQWFENWTYHTRTELGLPRTISLIASLPAIYSWGVSLQATEQLLLAFDIRYLDYINTKLFGEPVSEGGLGWENVLAVAAGARYQATDQLALMAGYSYNDNPIPSTGTLFNVQAPLITQNMVSLGTNYSVTDAMSLSIGYAYGFKNTITGPVRELTGAGVELSSDIHLLTFAMQFRFGGCRTPGCCNTVRSE